MAEPGLGVNLDPLRKGIKSSNLPIQSINPTSSPNPRPNHHSGPHPTLEIFDSRGNVEFIEKQCRKRARSLIIIVILQSCGC